MNRDELIQKALSRVKQASGKLYKNFTDNEGTFQQGKLAPVRQSYQRATGDTLGRQVMRPLAQAQQFVESPQQVRVPQVNPFNKNSSVGKTSNFLLNTGVQTAAAIASGAIETGLDTGRIYMGAAKGQLPAYSNLKSPLFKLAYNARGQNATPQQVASNMAGIGSDLLDVYTPKAILGAAKPAKSVGQALLQGAKVGSRVGGLSGGLRGIYEGGNLDAKDQAYSGLLGASTGYIGGGILGGALGGAGNITARTLDITKGYFKNKNPNLSDKRAGELAGKFLRDEFGRFAKQESGKMKVKGQFIKDPFITDADRVALRRQLNLPEDPTLPIGFQAAPKGGNQAIIDAQSARVTIQGPKGSRMMVGPKDAVKVPPTSGIGKIGETPVNDRVQSAKEYVNKLYTETIDRYNPLSRAAKGTKQEKAMRYALSQNYGAGSTGTYHVDYELSPILKSVDENDLKDFVIAQRDIELAGRGIKGSDAGEAQKIVSKLNQKYGGNMQPLNDAANKLYDYQSKMVKEYLVDTGVMSQEGYNAMVSSNQKYVPFKRIMDEMDDFLGAAPQKKGVGSVGSQGVVMKIKGSDRQIVDPLQSIIENTYKIVALGRRNQVAGTIASLADEYPDMVKPFDGEVGLKPVISVMRDGKAQKFLVPKDVAEAAKGLNEESLNAVIKILSIPTQVLRATATGYNPEFQAPNVVRDLQSAFVNVGLNPLRFAQGMAHLVKQDEVYQEFLKAGGKTSTIMLDRPELIKKVAQITKPKSHLITHPRDIWEALRTMGELSEQPTRIAVYEKTLKNALKNGIPREEAMKEAAYQAQEATVNFARRGSKTQAANALIAFINARTQGTDRLLRTMKNNPKSGLMRLALISQVPAVALYAWNRTFPEYNDERFVTEYDKRDNFIFMLPEGMPGGTRYLKLPKAEIGKFANPTEAFLSYADGKDSNIVDEMVRSFSNLSPVSSPGDLIPTAIRPPIENLSNYSFFTKREIVPEYKKEYPKPYQYTSATPSMYREAGAETDQSPAMLQNLTEGYTTGFGKMAAGAYEALAPEKLKTKAPYSGAPINNTPVLRRFAGGEKRTEEEQQLMDERAANSISFQIKDVKAGIKRGDIPEAEGARRINELEGKKQEAEKKLMTMGIGGNKVELPKDTGKPTFESKPEDPKNIVEKISLAAKGIGVDPGNTIKAIFTEEEMRKIEGNALILKRKERLNTLGDKNLQIDHKVSLGMGGDNSINNLQVMTVDQKAKKDKLEKRLIRDLQAGKITRQEAQKQIQDFTKNNPAGVPLAEFDASKQKKLLAQSPIEDEANKKTTDQLAKIKARISDEDKTLLNEDVRQYYLRDIDLTDNDNRYTKAIDEKKVWSRLGQVEKNDKLTANQKKGVVNGILKKIGVSENDYEYYKIARESTDLKTLAVYDKIEKLGNDRKAVFEYLIKGRRDVNGQTLISKGVLDNMVEDGTITKEERKLIEKFSFKDGKPRVKVSGRGKKAKLKKITVPKIRARYSGGGKLGQTLQSKGTSPIKMARLRVRPAQSTQQSTKLPQIYQTNPKL